jgi:hypothetical protein
MVPDTLERTVRLQVKITDGHVVLANGSALPALNKQTEGELVIPASSIVDAETRARLTGETNVRFLPKGCSLYARLQRDGIPAHLRSSVQGWKLRSGMRALFVSFELQEVLWLTLRTGKQGQLQDCAVTIPALGTTANSVNEAYTKISVSYEPNRRSHTGSVFRCVYVEEPIGVLAPLELVRKHLAANPPAPEES